MSRAAGRSAFARRGIAMIATRSDLEVLENALRPLRFRASAAPGRRRRSGVLGACTSWVLATGRRATRRAPLGSTSTRPTALSPRSRSTTIDGGPGSLLGPWNRSTSHMNPWSPTQRSAVEGALDFIGTVLPRDWTLTDHVGGELDVSEVANFQSSYAARLNWKMSSSLTKGVQLPVRSPSAAGTGKLALCWCAAGMVDASSQFRRVNGHLDLAAVRASAGTACRRPNCRGRLQH